MGRSLARNSSLPSSTVPWSWEQRFGIHPSKALVKWFSLYRIPANGIYQVSTAIAKSSWVNGSNGPGCAIEFSLLANLASLAGPEMLTVLHPIARRPARRVWSALVSTQLTCVGNHLPSIRQGTDNSTQKPLDYMHMANPETPIEETMRALVELKE